MFAGRIIHKLRHRRGVLCLAVLGSTALFIVLSHGGGVRTAAASSPSPSALARYGVLRRPAASSDAASANLPPAEVSRRQATGDSGLDQRASLDGSNLCVVVSGSATGGKGTYRACNNGGSLEASHQILATGAYSRPPGNATPPTPGAVSLVAGLAPDGVGAVTVTFTDGSSGRALVVDNGFHLMTGGKLKVVKSLSWTDAAGNSYTEGV